MPQRRQARRPRGFQKRGTIGVYCVCGNIYDFPAGMEDVAKCKNCGRRAADLEPSAFER